MAASTWHPRPQTHFGSSALMVPSLICRGRRSALLQAWKPCACWRRRLKTASDLLVAPLQMRSFCTWTDIQKQSTSIERYGLDAFSQNYTKLRISLCACSDVLFTKTTSNLRSTFSSFRPLTYGFLRARRQFHCSDVHISAYTLVVARKIGVLPGHSASPKLMFLVLWRRNKRGSRWLGFWKTGIPCLRSCDDIV